MKKRVVVSFALKVTFKSNFVKKKGLRECIANDAINEWGKFYIHHKRVAHGKMFDARN